MPVNEIMEELMMFLFNLTRFIIPDNLVYLQIRVKHTKSSELIIKYLTYEHFFF